MTEEQPRVTVVMPVYNSAKTISYSIDSVLRSGYENIELVVVDGGSSDGTVEVVRSYGAAVSKLISEPDEGYADAFNKGAQMASGDFVMMLAADDVMIPGSLEKAVRTVRDETDIWCGSVIMAEGWCYRLCASSGNLSQLEVLCSLRYPASLFRRTVYEQVGFMCTDYRCANDREFFLRCYRAGLRFQIDDIAMVVFATAGLSSSVELAFGEDVEISVQYGVPRPEAEAIAKERLERAARAERKLPLKKALAKAGLLGLAYRLKGAPANLLSKRELAKRGCVGSIPPYRF